MKPAAFVVTFVLGFAVLSCCGAARADDDGLFPEEWRIPSAFSVTALVNQAPVRDDLKLTDEQQKRISQLRGSLPTEAQNGEPGEANGIERRARASEALTAALAEILTPEQRRRHQQIALQQMFVSGRGIVTFLEISELKDAVNPDVGQLEQIEAIQDEASAAAMERIRSNRPGRVNLFTNPDISNRLIDMHEIAEQQNQQIAGLLTAEQKQRLLERLGPPMVGRITAVFLATPRPAWQPGIAGARRRPRLPFSLATRRRTATPGPATGLASTALAESHLNVALLSIEDVQKELKVSPERASAELRLGGDDAELSRGTKNLERWMTPEQLFRLRQLVLQVARDRSGPAALFEFREVVESLQLSEGQRATLAPLIQKELNSNRHALVLTIEPDAAKCLALEKDLVDRLNSVLTTAQRERLQEQLGEPLRRSISPATIDQALQPRTATRAKTTTALGQGVVENPLLITMTAIHDELQLSEEQRKAFRDAAAMIQNRDKLGEILTNDQLKRYHEILLQGEAHRNGPAAIFHSRAVIEALAPSDDQRQRLLEIIRDDTRAYLRVSREKLAEALPELDAATAAKLEAVLTEEQRTRLSSLLGEPAECLNEPMRPAGLP